MKYQAALLAVLLHSLSYAAVANEFNDLKQRYWHQWRGPLASGEAPEAKPPLNWDDRKNIRWKVAIPGQGSSTPIVWKNRVFVLSAVKTNKIDPKLPKPEDQPRRPFGITFPNSFYQFLVHCLDRETGKELWSKMATEQIPHRGHHGDNNFASASPTTDGERLYAWFGSRGLYCYSLDGNLLWKRDLGQVAMRRSFGEGCSPVVHQGKVIINRDNDGGSYIVTLNAKTGETIWRAERDESSAWATPLVVQQAGKAQVITNASNRVRSYDLSTGKVIWECGGQVGNVTPSPVTLDGLVYCMSGYQGSALYAIPITAQGDITNSTRVAWTRDRGTPYVPSPLLYEGLLYFNQSNNAILSCLEAKTGETVLERTRMPELRRIYASPVAADGRIYVVGRMGTTLVLRHGREFDLMAVNRLEDGIDASPALVDNQLFLRGRQFLYCVAENGSN